MKIKLILVLILITLMLSQSSLAESRFNLDKLDIDILAGQWSTHWQPKDYYNEVHKLKGIDINGFFYFEALNSYSDPIRSYGKAFDIKQWKYLETKVLIAKVEGYTQNPSFLISGFQLTFGKESWPLKVDVTLLPFVTTYGFRISF